MATWCPLGARRFQGGVLAVAAGIIGHKGLEVFDVEGLVQVAPHAGPLTGMRTDEAADPGEGVVLADHFQGLHEAALGHQGHVAGDVDARRAGRLAGGQEQFGADPGRTVLVVRVHPVLIGEIVQRSQDGIDRQASQLTGGLLASRPRRRAATPPGSPDRLPPRQSGPASP